jgi:hypothetical protein
VHDKELLLVLDECGAPKPTDCSESPAVPTWSPSKRWGDYGGQQVYVTSIIEFRATARS